VLTGKNGPNPQVQLDGPFGNCVIKKHHENPYIKETVCIKGCPIAMQEVIGKLEDMGLKPEIKFFARFREKLARRYDGNPEFDPDHFFMSGATGEHSIARSGAKHEGMSCLLRL
jgi:hypothetical protein